MAWNMRDSEPVCGKKPTYRLDGSKAMIRDGSVSGALAKNSTKKNEGLVFTTIINQMNFLVRLVGAVHYNSAGVPRRLARF